MNDQTQTQTSRRDADCPCHALDADPDTAGTHFFSCPQRVRQGGHRPQEDALHVSPENWQRIHQAFVDAQIMVTDEMGRWLVGRKPVD